MLEVLVDNMVLQPSIKHTPQASPWQPQSSAPSFSFPLARSRSQNQTASSPKQFDDFSFFESGPRPQTSDTQHPQSPTKSKGAKNGPFFASGKTASRAQTATTSQRQFKVKNSTNQPKNSVENWIPEEIRQRMMRRDLVVAKANFESTVMRAEASSREANRHKLNPLEKCKSHEKFGLEKKASCGLCLCTYLPVNLVLAVPLKAVLDIRDSWGTKFDPDGSVQVRVSGGLGSWSC